MGAQPSDIEVHPLEEGVLGYALPFFPRQSIEQCGGQDAAERLDVNCTLYMEGRSCTCGCANSHVAGLRNPFTFDQRPDVNLDLPFCGYVSTSTIPYNVHFTSKNKSTLGFYKPVRNLANCNPFRQESARFL